MSEIGQGGLNAPEAGDAALVPSEVNTVASASTSSMGRLTFGKLAQAWTGEATDFTPLLAEQLDALGEAINVDLASVGPTEVLTTGGRRIDIVAQDADGIEFVVENQYGRADHDHLTRGLAYAVARRARGLIVVAEEHRDEFRAVATYLNELAEHDTERGVAVWLVEARAVRIGDSPWAPLFTAVVEPNAFTAVVEAQKAAAKPTSLASIEDFCDNCVDEATATASAAVIEAWLGLKHRTRLGANHVVLEARGPATSGIRTVLVLFDDGRVLIPFGSYAGQNTGKPIPALTTPEFRSAADELFGFVGTEKQARTTAGWLTPNRVDDLVVFAANVAEQYAAAMAASAPLD